MDTRLSTLEFAVKHQGKKLDVLETKLQGVATVVQGIATMLAADTTK